ncbi:SCO family protein [Campylobacter sp. MIT 21-1685]|uniref:SCO family protein n=1 Tax=unclassified Campylobacter TaxID=2593542 RepID=UPI00224AA920|nr:MULTISPECIES: SCO family protein [unclassified Campylobacter]MCX2682821.1 SCO family protein [Campylobacter sp. MIT 21-1684]MCX2751033.1 SCO family protein [Campylobacter sp. MIT 21-1682]MCX2807302.1 SCO family protein [Campylobacter sp. MIT 21-1685]
MKNILAFIFLTALIIISFFLLNHKEYDFSLRSEFKEQTTLKDFAGKKLIVYFGYTFCPDVCPATLALLGKELKKIHSEKAYVLFISLDPLRDGDIEKTNEWLRYFYPQSAALIAHNEEELEKITKKYNVSYQKINLKDSAMSYSIAHSNELYLFDEKGKFVKSINDLNPEELYNELKSFLK